ncbi:FAD-binding protein [Pendulispora rubella]|uniref:FAD-binding protein n=1 Tax=Pendulispora rubella TaxID=2741070 RepID=A0ABZ2LBE8_9BACT
MTSKSRRSFLATAAGASAMGMMNWAEGIPLLRIPVASAASTLAAPSRFPSFIRLYQQAYQNWSEQITVERVWTCAPANAREVVALVNWAHQSGYRLRPKGMSHNWSPVLLPNGADVSKTILVDTTRLASVRVDARGQVKSVTAGAGTLMARVLEELEARGLGFAAIPAPGDITVGGLLAIGAHGTAIPARGETPTPGQTYGSLSNLILSITAVVWDASRSEYVLRTFQRNDPDIRAFLVHLGRAFVTEVTLQVGTNARLRCQSWYDIPARVVFAPPASAGPHSLAALTEKAGRVEAIWFPFTTVPWIKVWSLAPEKPWLARHVRKPYNYGFANSISQEQSECIEKINAGAAFLTPLLANLFTGAAGAGLIASGTWDLWGWSKDVLLYAKATTLRVAALGLAIVTSRENLQRVVSEVYAEYTRAICAYQLKGQFPMSAPLEIRITGLDQARDVQVAGAQSPLLSVARPRPDHPEWDTCVWINMLTIPKMPHANEFYAEMERWMWTNFSGSYASVRPEWSKGWAHTDTGAWTNQAVLSSAIPDTFRAGQARGDDWDTALTILDGYDPHRIFANPFLDSLLV